MNDTTDEVLAIERGFWTEVDDPRYFKEHMAEGGLAVIEPMGFVEKQQAVEMAADKPWEGVEMLDVQIRQIGPDCVIVAYHGRGHRAVLRSPTKEASPQPTFGKMAAGGWPLLPTSHGHPRVD